MGLLFPLNVILFLDKSKTLMLFKLKHKLLNFYIFAMNII